MLGVILPSRMANVINWCIRESVIIVRVVAPKSFETFPEMERIIEPSNDQLVLQSLQWMNLKWPRMNEDKAFKEFFICHKLECLFISSTVSLVKHILELFTNIQQGLKVVLELKAPALILVSK